MSGPTHTGWATGPEENADAATVVSATADTVEVRWADDGSVTRVAFDPSAVEHG